MDLSLTADHLALRAVAHSFFERHAPLEDLRRQEGEPPGYRSGLYEAMAALDWLRIGHDDATGGMGGLVDLAVIYHETGWALADTPHLESAVIAGGVLGAVERTELQSELLSQLLDGRRIVTPACSAPPLGTWSPDAIRGAWVDDRLRLQGTAILVPYASEASHFLVAARTGKSRSDGVTLAVVDATADRVAYHPMANLADAPLFEVTFDVSVDSDHVVGNRDEGWSTLTAVLERAAVLRAAEIAGAGQRLLELTIDYAKTREQFGTPIGRYQAVQYLCTDIAIDTHLSWSFALYAAGLADVGQPITLAASHAKAYASRAARRMAHRAHEVFAGIAFMVECDVQLFTRRLKRWELDLGDAGHHRQQIAHVLAHTTRVSSPNSPIEL